MPAYNLGLGLAVASILAGAGGIHAVSGSARSRPRHLGDLGLHHGLQARCAVVIDTVTRLDVEGVPRPGLPRGHQAVESVPARAFNIDVLDLRPQDEVRRGAAAVRQFGLDGDVAGESRPRPHLGDALQGS